MGNVRSLMDRSSREIRECFRRYPVTILLVAAVTVLAGDRNVLRGIILVSKKYKNFQERDFMFLSDIGVFKNCFRKLLLWKKRAANRILADTP